MLKTSIVNLITLGVIANMYFSNQPMNKATVLSRESANYEGVGGFVKLI